MADEDTIIRDIASQLADKDAGAVVVTEDGEPAGIGSDPDVALAVGHGEDPTRSPPATCSTATPPPSRKTRRKSVSRRMGEARVRRHGHRGPVAVLLARLTPAPSPFVSRRPPQTSTPPVA